jgi:WD40 repeat protein
MKRFYIIYILTFLLSSLLVFSTEAELIWMKQGEDASASAYQFSRDGKYFYVQWKLRSAGKNSYIIQKWDVENKTIEKEFPSNSDLSQMLLSNDDKFLLCAFKSSKLIDLIDLSSGETKTISDINSTGVMSSSITSFALSEDGKNIYVYHASVKAIQIIDFATLKNIDSLVLFNKVSQVKFSYDGKYAGTQNGDSTVSIRNMSDKTEMYRIKVPVGNFSVSNVFVNSEYFIINYLSLSRPENIEVYSMKTGNLVTKIKSSYDFPVSAMLNDNNTILTATYGNGYIEKLDISTNITSKTKIYVNGRGVIVSSNDIYLASKDSLSNLTIFDITSEKSILTFNKTNENLIRTSKILFSPDNNSVYAAGIKGADTLKKGQIIEYDFADGTVKNVYPISNSNLTDMVLSKDGNTIAAVDTTGKITILSNFHESGATQKTYDLKKAVSAIALSDDNTKLFATGYMMGFYYIDLKTDSIHYDFQDPYTILDLDPNLRTLALNSKADKLILAGKKKSIFVFNYNSDLDKYIKAYDFIGDDNTNPAGDGIMQIAFSNDDKYIYSSASDGYTHIFDAAKYTQTSKIGINPDSLKYYPSTAALSKDNSVLVTGDIYPGLSIFDVKTGNKLWSQKFEDLKNYRINSVTISADKNYMAFCSSEGTFGLFKINYQTSVEESVYNSQISISPNPAKDYIEINLDAIAAINPTLQRGVDEGCVIQIFDMLGTVVASIHPMTGSHRMNIENLAPGIYFIKIGNRVEKFVKI